MRNIHRSFLVPLALAASLAGCDRSGEHRDPAANPGEPVSPLPLPVSEPPLDRGALLAEVSAAASAAALARDDSERQRRLDGKRFEMRIRFGCPADLAATPPGAPFEIRFDPTKRTLRMRAAPDLTLDDTWIASIGAPATEAVEGFWLHRPWILADGCPVVTRQAEGSAAQVESEAQAPDVKSAPGDVPEPGGNLDSRGPVQDPRIGIAQFFSNTDPRTGRREARPYETTKVLGPDDQPSTLGYNLVLSGRLRQLPRGKVIFCELLSADSPPKCVVSAEFDRVWMEKPQSREVIADWRR